MKAPPVSLPVLLWFVLNAPGIAANLDNWVVRPSTTLSTLRGVAYGDGLFVVVGSETTILTSPNGWGWTPQSAGTTAPTLFSTGFGNGRYVAGGGEFALIRSATDGIHWTNGLSTTGIERIHGITYGYGLFIAVGSDTHGAGYILTSTNGLDWVSQSAPTTNTLFGVAPAISAGGIGWADTVLVAVGDRGTILSSTNGTDWLARNSGITVPLRAVVFHQGKLLVGGDFGVVLASSNGTTWSFAAPTSFDIKGLASSGDALVAVGNYSTSGRLQVSSDGLSWPGTSLSWPQPLQAVAYGGRSFVAAGEGGLIIESLASTVAGTNEWTKASSGSWEEPYWSLGQLPAGEQGQIAFRNSGSKVLAIGTNTTAQSPQSLAISNLTVEGPPDSFNQLLLNFAGLEVPLSIASRFYLGTNAGLMSYHSALQGGSFYLSAPGSFLENSTVHFNQIAVGVNAAAQLNLTDSSLSADLLVLGQSEPAVLNQSGGLSQLGTLQMPSLTVQPFGNPRADYFLSEGGTLISSNVSLGAVLSPSVVPGRGNFVQSGGLHTNGTLALFGDIRHQAVKHYGAYSLNGGLLASQTLSVQGGVFGQGGGTNYTQELLVDQAGVFVLSGGELVTSNTTVATCCCVMGSFIQNSGMHTVRGRLLLRDLATYELRAGTLSAPKLAIDTGAVLLIADGVLNNSELLAISAGAVRLGGQHQQLGRLQVNGQPIVGCFGIQPAGPALDFGFRSGTGETVLRFQDSRDVAWSGSALLILNWNGSTNGPGPDHLFVGNSSQGLTASQLNQVIFHNPAGWPPGNYPAQILASGEVMPALPPSLAFTTSSNCLVLSWSGDYELVTAANLLGPYAPMAGALSPLTNCPGEPQRYFRLRLVVP